MIVGRNGDLIAYATDDHDVVRVVNEVDGRSIVAPIALLLKFGWTPAQFDDPNQR